MKINPLEASWQSFAAWWRKNEDGAELRDLSALQNEHPVFSKALSLNRSVVAVIDVLQMKYLYWGGNVKELIGWDDQDFMKHGVQFSFTKYHPDDVPGIVQFSELINSYYRQLSSDKKAQFVSICDYRFIKPGGDYIRVSQQISVIKESENGDIWVMLSFITEVTNMKGQSNLHLRLSSGDSNTLYEFSLAESKLHLLECPTDRELEVFQKISQGYQRKQIADKLNISLSTVKTHCQNVFEKLRTNDSVETINLLKFLGLL